MVPCAAPVSHYRHWWFSNRLLSFAHHCALTLSLPLATANIHLPPTAWPALISSPCSSAFAWSLQPHLSCRFYHYSLGTDGFFCQLLSNLLIFFFLLHWSIPSIFPLSTLLLEEDIYSFQHASSCQHYCDLTLQCSYFHCKNNSNAATNNYHFIYRLSSVNNQDTLIKEWNISKSPPFLCWK